MPSPPSPASAISPAAPLASALPRYLDLLAEAGMSAHTISSSRLDLLQLARFLGRQPLSSVDLSDLRAFFSWLARQQGNSVGSLRRKTSTIKRFFRQLHAEGVLPADPSAGLIYPAQEAVLSDPLTPRETEALVEAASSLPWKALMLVLLDTGLKRDEVVALRWQDIELSADSETSPRLHVQHRRSSKRVRQRTLGITPRLVEALTSLGAAPRPEDGSVFGISARGIDFAVETCGKRAGIRVDQKITPQMLRDAFACARARHFRDLERADGGGETNVRREHDRLILRELGLSSSSVAADRYRAMVERLESDRTEETTLNDR